MYIIKSLNPEEIKEVYNQKMVRDFPPRELKPLNTILEMVSQGHYLTLGYYDADSTLMSYAFFAMDSGTVILDYYAVSSSMRGTGVGSSFISRFKEYFQPMGIDYLLLEVESVESSKNQEETDIRERRIHFYEKNGCVLSNVYSDVFDVEFRIMYLPFTGIKPPKEKLMEDLNKMYRLIVAPMTKTEEEYNLKVKMW